MEEVDIKLVKNLTPVDEAYKKYTTEQELLDMSRHFKELIQDKSEQIKKLSKIVTVCYGVLAIGDYDDSCTIFLRAYLEENMMELLGLEE